MSGEVTSTSRILQSRLTAIPSPLLDGHGVTKFAAQKLPASRLPVYRIGRVPDLDHVEHHRIAGDAIRVGPILLTGSQRLTTVLADSQGCDYGRHDV
jgi:hypothetical protein